MHPLYKKRDERGDEETEPTYGMQAPTTGAWELGAYYEATIAYKIHNQGRKQLNPPVVLPVGHKLLAHRAHYSSWGVVNGKKVGNWPLVRLVCFDPRFPTDVNQFLFVDMVVDGWTKKLSGLPFKKVESPLVALALAASGLA